MMRRFKSLCGLCVLCLLLGCGSKETESEQAESKTPQSQNADVSSLATPFSALPDHPQFELSDLKFPSPNSFTVRWRVTKGNASGSWSLAVLPGGNSIPTSLPVNIWDEKTSGEISGELQTYGGGSGPNLQSGCEVFMTLREADHTFKISNSVTAGGASTTSPHSASEEVIAKVEKERQEHRQKQQERAAEQALQQEPAVTNPPNPTPPRPTRQRPTRVSRPPGLVAVPPRISLPNGTELMAKKDDNQWVKASVVDVRADDQVKVHYEDGSDSPDEYLHRARLGIDPRVLVKLRTKRNE